MWEYVTIGVPGFEPGTSATRTQRSTGLSHTPDYSGNCIRTGWDSNPRGLCPHDFQSCALSHSATRPIRPWTQLHDLKRREWDSNPRGPETNALAGRRLKPLGHPSKTVVLIKRSTSELPR